MIFQAHRGVSTEYPENTMPAFRAAGYCTIVTKGNEPFIIGDFCMAIRRIYCSAACIGPTGGMSQSFIVNKSNGTPILANFSSMIDT